MKYLGICIFLGLASALATRADIDLITGDVGTDGMAIYEYLSPDTSTGTGQLSVFLTIQKNGLEQGYNTSGGLPFDTKAPNTRNILVSEVPIGIKGGEAYRVFFLDINENKNANSRFLSLDSVQIFLSDTPDQMTTDITTLGTKVYDLDWNGNETVLLDYSRNSGSGDGDMMLWVPLTAFAGFDPDSTYLYFYSEFGGHTGVFDFAADAGFEEWAVTENFVINTVPEPASMVILLLGAGMLVARRGIRRGDPADSAA